MEAALMAHCPSRHLTRHAGQRERQSKWRHPRVGSRPDRHIKPEAGVATPRTASRATEMTPESYTSEIRGIQRPEDGVRPFPCSIFQQIRLAQGQVLLGTETLTVFEVAVVPPVRWTTT
jgi:hypothetical protein